MNKYYISRGFGVNPLALSIREPWITCGLHYGKPVENRGWMLPYHIWNRRVFLHSSAKLDSSDGIASASRLAGVNFFQEGHLLAPLGHIVATCVFTRQITKPGTLPAGTDKWFFGPYGWVWAEIKPLKRPLPCKGRLKFWSVPFEILEQIEAEDLLPFDDLEVLEI